MIKRRYYFILILYSFCIQGQSMLMDYPENGFLGGIVLNLHDIAYGPGVTASCSYLSFIEPGIQYSFLYEKDNNYKVQYFMPYIRFFLLKPFSLSNLQPSLEFFYLDETYYLDNFFVEHDPRRFFYRIGGSLSYKKKLREIYTIIPELGIFRTTQKLEGVNLRVEGEYPVHFIYNSYRDTNQYVEVKFSFCLIRPLSKNLDLVFQFQNFMNRDEFQDQFMILLVGTF
jgi:hypothetical protein